MGDKHREALVRDFVNAIQEENAAVFAGAGLSIPAGMVNWRNLLREIAEDIDLDINKEQDLIAVAQYHLNRKRGRAKINQALISEFAERATITENHRILASLPIRTYWTTNYDTLIEDSLRKAFRRPDVKLTPENLTHTLPHRDAVIYKMHGDVSLPHDAVVTKDDYETYETKRQLFSTALRGDLVSKTFLFIGFSFDDPNLAYILARIRILLGKNRRTHYCLLRRVQETDFSEKEDYEYARARQDLQVEDLQRYGITGLLLDSYEEYTEVLKEISARFLKRRVFISGSAVTYDPWTAREAQELLEEISARLIAAGYAVVTGYGLGVGSHVLNGALKQLEKEGSRRLDDRIILRPFPLHIEDVDERRERWSAYRREMISEAGVALFVFGNKEDTGSIVDAGGVREEFDICRELDVAVVPLGCTGSMARTLHQEVLERFSEYYPDREDLKDKLVELGSAEDAKVVADRTISLVITLSACRT